MPLQALTIDFWNTIVVAQANGKARQAQRAAFVQQAVKPLRPSLTDAELHDAFKQAFQSFDHQWRTVCRTMGAADLLRYIWKALDVAVTDEVHEAGTRVFEDGILYDRPALAQGVQDALAWAAERFRLGIISDTMFSPGRVIRTWLAQEGLADYFDTMVFSDEVGCSKPDPRMFKVALTDLQAAPEHTAHIGDLRHTDVAGARHMGLRAIQYTGVQEDETPEPVPHLVLTRWMDLPTLLDKGA